MTYVVLAVMIAVLGTAVAAPAAPGDPFGAGEPACIPPDADVAKCENAMMTAYAKAVACVAKCHVQRAKEKLEDGTALALCEQTCRGNYDQAVAKVTKKCPTYDVQPTFAEAEASVDATPVYPCADSEGPTITDLVCTSDPLVPGSGSCSFTVVDASPPVHFQCALDEGPPVECDAQTFTFTELAPGRHDLRIIAVDRFGNTGPPDPDFTVTSRVGDGHVVAIGHDYATVDLSTSTIVGNAVGLSAAHGFVRPISVVTFTGNADPTETANARAAIEQQLGVEVSFAFDFSDPTSEGLRTACEATTSC